MRARLWLFFSYMIAFGSVAGAVAVLLKTTGSGEHILVGVVGLVLNPASCIAISRDSYSRRGGLYWLEKGLALPMPAAVYHSCWFSMRFSADHVFYQLSALKTFTEHKLPASSYESDSIPFLALNRMRLPISIATCIQMLPKVHLNCMCRVCREGHIREALIMIKLNLNVFKLQFVWGLHHGNIVSSIAIRIKSAEIMSIIRSSDLQAGLLQTGFIIFSGLLLWGIRTRPDDGYSFSFWATRIVLRSGLFNSSMRFSPKFE